MTNLINKITKFAMIPILAGSLNGCRDRSNDFCKTGKYNGYEVTATFNELGREMSIYSDIKRESNRKAMINGYEDIENLKDKKRFSKIIMDKEIPRGHPLEIYMDLDSLEKIYDYVHKNGEDCREKLKWQTQI